MSEHVDYDHPARPWTAQPPPVAGGEPVHPVLIRYLREHGNGDLADLIAERDRFGRAKYDTPLTTHNGRNAMCDAAEEAGDLAVYLQQAALEGDRDAALWLLVVIAIAERIATRVARDRAAADHGG